MNRVTSTLMPQQGYRVLLGWGLGILVSGAAAYGLVVLVGHAFAACDVGINAGANSLVLQFVLPVLWVVNLVLFGVVYSVVSGPTWQRKVVGLLAALFAVVLMAWLLFAWLGTPSGYPDPICPSNVPPWWPSWIPA